VGEGASGGSVEGGGARVGAIGGEHECAHGLIPETHSLSHVTNEIPVTSL